MKQLANNLWRMVLLRGLKALLDQLPTEKCPRDPSKHEEFHSLACTLMHIRKGVHRAVEFWEEGNRGQRADS